MISSNKISYLFRRYPAVRVICGLFCISLILACIFLIGFRTKPVPEIESITPSVGAPGDVILIKGKNFGDVRDMNYVEIAGSKLTASSYISWADDCIKIVLPSTVQDGLVYVCAKSIRSKPTLFANEVDIPVPVSTNQISSKPVISELSAQNVSVGQELVIQGNNFGEVKNNSKVLFTIDYNNKIRDSEYVNQMLLTENMIAASEENAEYLSWSNNEIKVRVPDGATTGVVIVDTGSEKSEPAELTVNESVGTKSFANKKIYLLQYTADIADVVSTDFSTITLRCPVPCQTAAQPDVQITETVPTPIFMNYQNNLIQQITKVKTNAPKTVFTQTFVLPVYEVQTTVNGAKVENLRESEKTLFDYGLKADSLVPSDNEKIIALAQKIVGNEKNSYKKAKLIYDYFCETYRLASKTRKNDANPLDVLRNGRGDAYDFAVIYTALLRAAGVPAITDAGILIAQDMKTQSHWWCEFYVKNFGWVPVDVSLALGLEYKKWNDGPDMSDKDFYFGNLDSHHIAFSRGWNALKPFSQDNKIVQQPRSFALQSIWEEASSSTVKYSSYWSVPVIKGVY